MISGKTKIFCLLGNPVEHSLSPTIHNSAFDYQDRDCRYLCFAVKNIKDGLAAVRALNIAGGNITIPHKEKALRYLDQLHPSAEKTGAVNTITNNDGCLTGYNTDAIGALNALKQVESVSGKKIIMAGAGGAARAIAYILTQNKVQLTIVNRNIEKAKKLAKQFQANYAPLDDLNKLKGDILINATSVGMNNAEKSIADIEQCRNFSTIFDIVYSPLHTLLLQNGRQANCKLVYGDAMLLYQAVEAYKIWLNCDPPWEIMKKAMRQSHLQN